jgi:hypothetical protein
VQRQRDTVASKTFFRKLLKGPDVCATGDCHRSAEEL